MGSGSALPFPSAATKSEETADDGWGRDGPSIRVCPSKVRERPLDARWSDRCTPHAAYDLPPPATRHRASCCCWQRGWLIDQRCVDVAHSCQVPAGSRPLSNPNLPTGVWRVADFEPCAQTPNFRPQTLDVRLLTDRFKLSTFDLKLSTLVF